MTNKLHSQDANIDGLARFLQSHRQLYSRTRAKMVPFLNSIDPCIGGADTARNMTDVLRARRSERQARLRQNLDLDEVVSCTTSPIFRHRTTCHVPAYDLWASQDLSADPRSC